jgi:hypothetical protein
MQMALVGVLANPELVLDVVDAEKPPPPVLL